MQKTPPGVMTAERVMLSGVRRTKVDLSSRFATGRNVEATVKLLTQHVAARSNHEQLCLRRRAQVKQSKAHLLTNLSRPLVAHAKTPKNGLSALEHYSALSFPHLTLHDPRNVSESQRVSRRKGGHTEERGVGPSSSTIRHVRIVRCRSASRTLDEEE